MGDEADYEIEKALINDYEEEDDLPCWSNSEGDTPVKEMKDSHLVNSINYLRKRDQEGSDIYTHLINELTVRRLLDSQK